MRTEHQKHELPLIDGCLLPVVVFAVYPLPHTNTEAVTMLTAVLQFRPDRICGKL